ncbi:MAG: hypothetical protein K0R46_2696 [Herbinix sp.]|nr:hypothetical protein [Herbinix sp.]
MNDFLKDENGQPMFLLGLQSHNSSTGTDMIQKTIQAIKQYGGNLLEAPVYWNVIEREKDCYDMKLVKDLIDETRDAGLKLIILWFATSKNGHPNYVPEYIKLQPEIYRLAIGANTAPVASLSPHCMDTLERDQLAFEKLMIFLKEYDERERTVIAVQIENEMGYESTDRDYSKLAQADYVKSVPEEIRKVKLIDTGIEEIIDDKLDSSTWRGCFGRHAHEAFSSWYHARYIERIAEMGKKQYNLPMIINVMLGEQGYEETGRCYQGGAAVGRMLDIWKIGAPSIDLICPDIYESVRSKYERICSRYSRLDNALFIPESPIAGEANAINSLLAVADYEAIGICCFGAESALNNDGTLTEETRTMAVTMKAIGALAPLLITYRKTGAVHALVQEEFAREQYLKLEQYHVIAHFINKNKAQRYGSRMNLSVAENQFHLNERGRGLLIQTGENEFYLSGAGLAVDFIHRPDPLNDNPYPQISSRQAGQLNFLSVEEGHFEGDKWITDYLRNGDEANYSVYVHGGQAVRIRLNPNLGMDLW